jgi:hypothetical protein
MWITLHMLSWGKGVLIDVAIAIQISVVPTQTRQGKILDFASH